LFGESGKWNKVRTALLKAQILECDEIYRKDQKSKWYRLGDKSVGYEPYLATITDHRLLARLNKADTRSNLTVSLPAHQHLANWITEFRVDMNAAKPWICRRHNLRKHALTFAGICQLQSGEGGIVVDDYQRAHSPITNMRRDVRHALRVNCQPLEELDLSNSQPLILGLMTAYLVTGEWKLDDVRRLGTKGPLSDPFPNLPMTRVADILLPDDLRDYLDICERGQFYHALGEVWNLPWTKKSEIKRLAYRCVLFGRPRPGGFRWEAFKSRWLSVSNMLFALNSESKGASARACQRIESNLIIGGVVGRLRRCRPEEPVQTIHDSVLVTSASVPVVRQIMFDEFESVGLTPTIEPKNRHAAIAANRVTSASIH
jgi:hypothetical protein